VEKIFVDEDWYLTAYPDVSAAIKRDVVPTAKAHYCQYGYTNTGCRIACWSMSLGI